MEATDVAPELQEPKSMSIGPFLKEVLKFGRSGQPRHTSIVLADDHRHLEYKSNYFSLKFGQTNKIDVEKIVRIMPGQNTAQFQRHSKSHGHLKSRSLSIVYNRDGHERTLDLIANSPKDFKSLFRDLSALIEKHESVKQKMSVDQLYLREIFKQGDITRDGVIEEAELTRLVPLMNIHMPSRLVILMFHDFDKDRNGTLDYNEFAAFVDFLRQRVELKVIWNSFFKKSFNSTLPIDLVNNSGPAVPEFVDIEEFKKFMLVVHQEIWDNIKLLKVLRQAMPNIIMDDSITLDANMWQGIVLNAENNLFDPAKLVVYQDMNHPISHYFIASSHNTYLEGDQLTSNSSVNRYIRDLMEGCRCVELDCWDGEGNEPIIYHGHTLTSKIFFTDVIRAIRDYGFKKSPYPIILSIENHCCVAQQGRLAAILKEELQDMLCVAADENLQTLPSPNQLTGKVLLKGKRLHGTVEGDDDGGGEEDAYPLSRAGSTKSNSSDSVTLSVFKGILSGKSDKENASSKSGKEKMKIHPDLSDVTFLGYDKIRTFDPTGNTHVPCVNVCSFSESNTAKFVSSEEILKGWILHNQIHLSRIYPKGTRVDSSNYDPTAAWAAGNQLVALNYQTSDMSMHINRGKFRDNGGCGYVLKPEWMLTSSGVDPPPPSPPIKFIINVLSAHQLPKPNLSTKIGVMDPFVLVSIHGVNSDNAEQRTKTISNNGFNPIWNEVKTFTVTNPDLAVLVLTVTDEEYGLKSFVAYASMPLGCVRTGLRTCPLYDQNGKRDGDSHAFATLTVIVTIENIL